MVRISAQGDHDGRPIPTNTELTLHRIEGLSKVYAAASDSLAHGVAESKSRPTATSSLSSAKPPLVYCLLTETSRRGTRPRRCRPRQVDHPPLRRPHPRREERLPPPRWYPRRLAGECGAVAIACENSRAPADRVPCSRLRSRTSSPSRVRTSSRAPSTPATPSSSSSRPTRTPSRSSLSAPLPLPRPPLRVVRLPLRRSLPRRLTVSVAATRGDDLSLLCSPYQVRLGGDCCLVAPRPRLRCQGRLGWPCPQVAGQLQHCPRPSC